MKIAIFYSGFMRAFKKTHKNHNENVIKKFNCDVYINSWDKVDCGDTVNSLEDDLLKIYNPKKCELEKYFEFDTSKYTNHYGRCNNVISMYYKIHKGFNMIPKDYDIYIRMRSDQFFVTGPTLEDLKRAALGKDIIIPKTNINNGVNDQFAISNYDLMKKYSDLYLRLDEYYNKGQKISPEPLLAYHVKENDITMSQSDISFGDYTYNDTQSTEEEWTNRTKEKYGNIIL